MPGCNSIKIANIHLHVIRLNLLLVALQVSSAEADDLTDPRMLQVLGSMKAGRVLEMNKKNGSVKLPKLPAALPVPATTEERFGLDFTPAGDALAAALHAQQTGLTDPPSAEEGEELFGGGRSNRSLKILAACMMVCILECMLPPC